MNRTKAIFAGSYAVLLAVILALSWALRKARRRKGLHLPEMPESVLREVSDLASRAAGVAADVNKFASHTAGGAKSVAQRAAGVLR